MNVEVGTNEFLGFCLPYAISSDQGEIFRPGAFREAEGQQILIFLNYQLPCGIGVFHNSAEGLWIKGRVCNLLTGGITILKKLHRDINYFEFCVHCECEPQAREHRPAPNGKYYRIIEKAFPREISFVTGSCFPDTYVGQLGPVSFKHSNWDYRFAQPQFLLPIQIRVMEKFLEFSKKTLSQTDQNGGTEIDWFESVKI